MTQPDSPTSDQALTTEALLRAARNLGAFGRARSRLDFLEAARTKDNSVDILKECFWAALKLGEYANAACFLDDITHSHQTAGADSGELDTWLGRARQKLDSQRPVDPAAWENRLQTLRDASCPPSRAGQPRPRRLCYVLTGSLPWMQTGYAMRSQAFVEALQHTGMDIRCVTRPGFPADRWGLDETATYPPNSTIGGVTYHHIAEPSRKKIKRDAYFTAAAEALVRSLTPVKPGVIMAASDYNNALPALLAARQMGLPFIYDVRGFWELSRLAKDPDHADDPEFATALALESLIARQADQVLTLTGAMRDELVRRGVEARRIELAPNACDPAALAPRARDRDLAQRLDVPMDIPVVGYIGSFNAYEGLDDLVRACGHLRRRGLTFRLLLVGKSASADAGQAMEDQLRELAVSEGISDWLIMPGQVPREEVEAWYSLIDIAPFPRKSLIVTELVSPMKPLEALSMAKLVIASDLAPLAEMIEDGKTGLLVARGDPDGLANALAKAVADPDLRQRLGRAGRRWALTERSWDKVARRARKQIEGLLTQ